jgi:hypothetical protein
MYADPSGKALQLVLSIIFITIIASTILMLDDNAEYTPPFFNNFGSSFNFEGKNFNEKKFTIAGVGFTGGRKDWYINKASSSIYLSVFNFSASLEYEIGFDIGFSFNLVEFGYDGKYINACFSLGLTTNAINIKFGQIVADLFQII